MIASVEDRSRIRDFCRRDPARYVFHLGDLDDLEWEQSRYFARLDGGEIDELMLVYHGLSLPSVQLFGRRGELGTACRDFFPELPEAFHLHCHDEDLPILGEALDLEEGGLLHRMHWQDYPDDLRPPSIPARLLDQNDLPALVDFLNEAFPTAFFEAHQLAKAKFTGCFLGGRLVSCAGFHVLSYAEGVGALGSIATHPEMRGKGYAASATLRLMEEVRGSIPLLALNVQVDNTSAVSLYRNLGFRDVFRYRETSATRLPLD